MTARSQPAESDRRSMSEAVPTPDVSGSVPPATVPEQSSERDALTSQSVLGTLELELELARAREARLRVDNHRLAKALEEAERQLAYLPTLREEAEVGRQSRDTAFRLQMLEHSLSWRLTRPLRSMSEEARRVAQRLRRP